MQKTFTFHCSHCGFKETSTMTQGDAVETIGKRCKACTKGYLRVSPIKTDTVKP